MWLMSPPSTGDEQPVFALWNHRDWRCPQPGWRHRVVDHRGLCPCTSFLFRSAGLLSAALFLDVPLRNERDPVDVFQTHTDTAQAPAQKMTVLIKWSYISRRSPRLIYSWDVPGIYILSSWCWDSSRVLLALHHGKPDAEFDLPIVPGNGNGTKEEHQVPNTEHARGSPINTVGVRTQTNPKRTLFTTQNKTAHDSEKLSISCLSVWEHHFFRINTKKTERTIPYLFT